MTGMDRIVNTSFVDGGTPPDYWERYAIYEQMTPLERGKDVWLFLCHECPKCRLSGGPCFMATCTKCGGATTPITLEEARTRFAPEAQQEARPASTR